MRPGVAVRHDLETPLRRSLARLEAAARRSTRGRGPFVEISQAPPQRSFFPQSRRDRAKVGVAAAGVVGAFVALVKALDDAGVFRALAALFR